MAPQSSTADAAGYLAEVRFGIVMYGGVSLAIYINGVANELYELAAATPRSGRSPGPRTLVPPCDAPDAPRHADGTPCRVTTRDVYRRLSRLVNDRDLLLRYDEHLKSLGAATPLPDPMQMPDAPHPVRTRFVVDVIAGTSAGGINGIFLAKALANDQPFAPLRDLWVREGDLAGLLNDEASYNDQDVADLERSRGEPASLLNSDRMYRKLRKALRLMTGTPPSAPPPPSPYVDELDLFVTTTDIRGSRVTLRLFDNVVREKRHRHVFHFRYGDDGQRVTATDLAPEHDAFLAFAARCTSSFPFAFEPMTLGTLKRLEPGTSDTALAKWLPFFESLSPAERADAATRAFGDGGYLDNKPFAHAVDALAGRTAVMPVDRKLLYVEPAPEDLRDGDGGLPPPDAISNALAALTQIPRYETIREDLEAVLRRNRRIERIDRIVRLGERDLDSDDGDPMARVLLDSGGKVPAWRTLDTRQMRRYYGDAFLPYYRLRQYTVTDNLADRMGRLWALERDSDQVYAMRALVRAWRDERYVDLAPPSSTGDAPPAPPPADWRGPPNAFLDDFDLAYRERRTAFLLRRVDQLLRLFSRRRLAALTGLSESDEALARGLERRSKINLFDDSLGPDRLAEALQALETLKRDLTSAHARLRAGRHETPADAGQEAARTALRGELLRVLDLLLLRGEGSQAGQVPGSATDGTWLSTKDGPPIRVIFTADQLKLPSATRTLQEGVFERAKTLLRLARAHRQTTLHDALDTDLARIQQLIGSLIREAPDTEPQAARLAWVRLGSPALGTVPSGKGNPDDPNDPAAWLVVVRVGDTGVAELDTPMARGLRKFLGEYYLRFDSYDQMSFPLYYDTDSGELATVEVVRISPEDATNLIDERDDPHGRTKLAGTALANFGAFLQRRWRTNDIMWGRLDGAERLITALLPGIDEASSRVRQALVMQAHRTILRESLQPGGLRQVTEAMCAALEELERSEAGDAATQSPAAGKRARPMSAQERRAFLLADMVQRLKPSSAMSQQRLQVVLAALMEEDRLVDWVRESRDVDRQADPKTLLDNASRAITITGRVLENVARTHGREQALLRWITRTGLVFQGLLVVSVPGGLRARVFTHWLKLLYAFEAVALAFGFLLGSEGMRSAALTALGLTATVHLATLVLRDVMKDDKRWLVKGAVIAGVAVAVLAGLGALALMRFGLVTLLNL